MEIERKFLVNSFIFKVEGVFSNVQCLTQGYLSLSNPVVRVRYTGPATNPGQAWVTFKGEGLLSREEFEFEFPAEKRLEAVSLLNTMSKTALLRKNRYSGYFAGKRWEVDEFLGPLDGLWMAEIELSSVDESFVRPPWVTKEVTEDSRYSNVNLVRDAAPPSPR